MGCWSPTEGRWIFGGRAHANQEESQAFYGHLSLAWNAENSHSVWWFPITGEAGTDRLSKHLIGSVGKQVYEIVFWNILNPLLMFFLMGTNDTCRRESGNDFNKPCHNVVVLNNIFLLSVTIMDSILFLPVVRLWLSWSHLKIYEM